MSTAKIRGIDIDDDEDDDDEPAVVAASPVRDSPTPTESAVARPADDEETTMQPAASEPAVPSASSPIDSRRDVTDQVRDEPIKLSDDQSEAVDELAAETSKTESMELLAEMTIGAEPMAESTLTAITLSPVRKLVFTSERRTSETRDEECYALRAIFYEPSISREPPILMKS